MNIPHPIRTMVQHMSVRQYNLGKKHALEGIRAMAHRKLRPYDSRTANESYIRGYSDGTKERRTPRLDYSKALNNQLFIEGNTK